MHEKYKNHWEAGKYVCANCGQPLFESGAKFDSGTAWPSFRQTMPDAVATKPDHSLGMERTEVLCGRCRQHLGHVFPDGKICGDSHPDAGMRYCILSDALSFKEPDAKP